MRVAIYIAFAVMAGAFAALANLHLYEVARSEVRAIVRQSVKGECWR